MRILLLGGSGQLGKSLNSSSPKTHRVYSPSHARLDVLDRCALLDVVQWYNPKVIINATAYTDVDAATINVHKCYNLNEMVPTSCAIAAKKYKARLIHISSDFVFNGNKITPYTINDKCDPISVYGMSKMMGERPLYTYDNSLTIRTSWLYSIYGTNFVKTMLRVMRERNSVQVVDDQIGTPTYAAGLANIIWRSLNVEGFSGTQHWSDSGSTSRYGFAVAIYEEARELGMVGEVDIIPVKSTNFSQMSKRPAYSVLDCSNSYNIFGEAPHWRIALRSMLKSLKAIEDTVS